MNKQLLPFGILLYTGSFLGIKPEGSLLPNAESYKQLSDFDHTEMMEPKRLWIILTILLFIEGWCETEGCWEYERIALLQLKPFFNDPYYLRNWVDVQGSNCCKWDGVECSITSRRVIGLSLNYTRQWKPGGLWYLNASLFLPFQELKSLYLKGNQIADFVHNEVTLSSALGNLEILVLSRNFFDDSIFSSSKLNSLTNLKILDLSSNRIRSLHHFQGKKTQLMINLEVLDLSYNLLKNTTLAYLSGLSSLKSLSIGGNQLQGSIDIKVLNSLAKLKKLDMSDNKLQSLRFSHDGERQLKLINVEELDFSWNSFNNSILALLGGLQNLKSLNIRRNQLNGSINIKVLNSLAKLEKLDMSDNELEGLISSHDGERQLKLINLKELDLSGNSFNNSILAMFEKKSLGKLKVARLDGVFVNGTVSLLQIVETFSSVKTFFLRGNNLNGTISTQELHVSSKVEELLLDNSYLNNNILQNIGVLPSLKALSLSGCGLTGTLPTKGWCDLRNLEALDLSENALEGTLPSCLGNLSSLHFLDISDNRFTGNAASTSLGNLTLLGYVALSKNLFQVPIFFTSFANHSHLKVLLSDQNKLVREPTSQIWIPKFQLKVFRMSNCTTKEPHNELPKFLHYQYDLSIVDLSYNNFGGKIPSWLLVNNTRLEAYLMAGNSFTGPLQLPLHPNPTMSIIDISDNKIQGQIPMNICSTFPYLSGLNLSGNTLEGGIPPCLGGLNTCLLLDLSYNHLSGGIPEELGKSDSLWFLRLSNNNLSGKIAPTIFSLPSLYLFHLDGNNFVGEIPNIDISTSMGPLSDMDLSNNNLSGKLPRWLRNMSDLMALALSNNQLEGPIPMELCYWDHLEILDLSQNNFSGPIPSCLDARSIRHLHLSKNRLTGNLAGAFFNSYSLVTLDLSENYLTGEIPSWLGNLSALSVLLLKANYFTGGIPVQLCESYSLSIIDLSQNKLSGPIPSCLGNLTLEPNAGKSFTKPYFRGSELILEGADYYGMTIFERDTSKGIEAIVVPLAAENYMEVRVDYTTKGGFYTYKGKILEYMSGIDLSCNRLTGEIPLGIGNLSEIHSLNLSHNNLTGVVPSTFSKLKQIESLDLSYNNLIGRIPVQLVELNALEVFNVSYNNLSGSIPDQKAQFGTFDESSYLGNRCLCGPPLHKNCTETDTPSTVPYASNGEEEGGLVDKYVFYVSFWVSYAIVLMAIAAILYINPYWRRAWFYFIGQCINRWPCA
ncbi:LRR receptor-like serine/threonine-protein kinase GSO1 [Durio zibethinus]|uniref:LRR receptor-like serine/threonine-protein kinase GSO1 n=1 Tax=Durio zibethinus TaxID=66656 RepID=A0A6P5XK95_DURZI|nr:LRR receptor-like serine/threonine-protein kinase GSO1 [Durio zibethinus]